VRRLACLAALLPLLPAALSAQSAVAAAPAAAPSTLTAFASLGLVHNLSSFELAMPGLERNGLAGGVRLMWQPGQKLAAGIEIGHTSVYSVSRPITGGTLDQTMDAWPILLVFSMSPVRRLYVNLGTGPAISTSSATLLGSSSSSSAFGASFMASGMYLVPLSPTLSLGGELRYLRLSKYEDNNVSFQVTLGWKLR
jgi:hypothetical protein